MRKKHVSKIHLTLFITEIRGKKILQEQFDWNTIIDINNSNSLRKRGTNEGWSLINYPQWEENNKTVSIFELLLVCVAAMMLNFNVEEYRCNFCNCPYSSQSHLKRHLTRGCFMDPSFRIEERRTMNRIESRNHVCPKCSQGYKNKRTLDTHLRTVCGREPKFHCPYCGLRSKHPPNIYTHIRRRHKGEDLFLIVDKDQRCWSIVASSISTFVNFFFSSPHVIFSCLVISIIFFFFWIQ